MAEKRGTEMTVREAGKLGGQKRKEQLGPEGYAAMGRKGGKRVQELIRLGKLAEQQAKEGNS